MANDFTIDPFTQIYDGIWALLEANTAFTDLVKPRNRIKFSGTNEKPTKAEVAFGDLPEVALIPTGGVDEFTLSSSSVALVRTFTIMIATGTLRLNKYLFPVEWACLKALHAGVDDLNLSFVQKFRVGNSTQYPDNDELNRGSAGWSSVIDIEVTIIVPKTDL
ncbi:MAG: hypothetical protein ACTSQB_00160 [Candidatus Heimdallarchaeota archaeon]